MRFRKLLPLFLLFALTQNALATTFTVTSNADAGPGSLREAITNANANGIATQDIIQFNLPGSLPSDRTIRLKTQLPALTSNIVIDGSTQPGAPFGVSDARVILEPMVSPAYFNGLVIYYDTNNLNNITQGIEIYGLYIRNFAQINSFSNYDSTQGSGIYFIGGGSGIIIGAPGKGNVICGNINAIYSNYNYYSYLADITIQSNIIGLSDDGTTINSNIYGINSQVNKTISIGGANANQGNTIAGNVSNIVINNSNFYQVNALTVSIQNNKIGTDYSGKIDYKQSPLFAGSAFITTYGIEILAGNATSTISNNLISGQRSFGIYITNGGYTITGNKIGTDVTGTNNLGNAEGIRVGQSSRGTIGGPNAADANIIAYNQYGIEALNSSQTLITQNSIFCNSDYGISVPANFPFVEILTMGSGLVSGLATPNSAVELFYIDACPNSCQGKQYLTTVKADGAGNWTYTGGLSGSVIATATDGNKNTSAFSNLSLRSGEVAIKNYTCSYQGSITISPARTGFLFHWDKKNDDGTLTPIADVQNISGLLPGSYQLTIQYPGGCQKVTQTFIIQDSRLSIQAIIPPVPVCRQKQFSVDAYYKGGTGNVVFSWLDASGKTVAYGKPGTIQGGGTFTLQITDDAGCSVTSTPFTIVPKPGPDFDYSHEDLHSARCGMSDGYIKGITAFDIIGTATYQWFNAANNTPIVGATNTDLLSVPGGTYYLVITDQSQCSPYASQSQYVNTTNSVIIYSDATPKTPATCGLNNGAIGAPYVTNADKFDWYSPTGAQISSGPAPTGLNNLVDGTYRMVATNTVTNCSNSADFIVPRIIPDVFSPQVSITPATCGLNNGGVTLSFSPDFNIPKPITYKWVDAANNVISTTASIKNRADGIYRIYYTDKNNCSSGPFAYTVNRIPILAFDPANNPTAVNDQCTLSTGSITGVKITGGQAPFQYTWTDQNGKTAGTSQDLLNIGKGTYTLTITDAIGCQPPLTAAPVTVGNDQITLTPPVLNNLRICNPELVSLTVLNPENGIYKLYKNKNDIIPFTTSNTSTLSLNVTQTSDFYVTYNSGSCESAATKVHVEVILIDITMGNSFTPNNDSINDYWEVKGLEKFPGSVVSVFTRAGYKVFESKNYNVFFDGKFNGKPLPVGTYYYVINLNTPCKILAGSLALIR